MGMNAAEAKAWLSEKKGGQREKNSALEAYSMDLTQMAREGRLDPVIGREQEIQRVVQILSRRTKNNPCLIGEPGVGKTAVVEGLRADRRRAGPCTSGRSGYDSGCPAGGRF